MYFILKVFLLVLLVFGPNLPSFAEGPIAQKIREGIEARRGIKNVSLAQPPEWAQPDACRVKSLERLKLRGGGFAWSHQDEDRVFTTHKDTKGKVQVYRSSIGSQAETCMTCRDIPGGPLASQNKGGVSFHPDGKHLIMMVEMKDYPLKKVMGNPGAGWFFNIWMTTQDLKTWWQLTDYPPAPPHGVLMPKVSPDGKKVAWGQLYGDPGGTVSRDWQKEKSNKGPIYGRWQLNVADLVQDASGKFSLENVVSSKVSDHDFYETQGWSPDGKKLLFSSDIGRDTPYKIDIWMRDLVQKKSVNLTDSEKSWDEFADFSPDGKKIAIMSSRCCPSFDPVDPHNYLKSLASEIYLMDEDGGRLSQLTYFNTPGRPEHVEGRTIAGLVHWNAGGDKLLIEYTHVSKDLRRWSQADWLLIFEGSCGKAQ